MDRAIYGEYQTIPDLFTDPPPCRPVRYVIDLGSKTLRSRSAMTFHLCPDFPAIDANLAGARCDDFWMLAMGAFGQPGRKFFDRVVHGSWQAGDVCDQWVAPAGNYLGGEPVYAVNPGNDGEGVVIVQHLLPAENRAEILLFEAHSLTKGPIATLPLGYLIHPGFHASFHFD
jgi:carotenoid cleavage dioxygenase-like enzyme